MPRIATRHAHKLAYRRRFSLGVRMLGCLVLLAGSMVLAAALAEVAKGALSRSVWLMISFGVVLFAGGAVLFCGERGVLFDREARRLKFWWGVFWPLARSFHDLQPYQAVGVQLFDNAGLARWRVALWNAQGERLDLFELANGEAAQLATRQVAMFLSLVIAPPPVPATEGATADMSPALPAAASAPVPDKRWIYREHFGLPWRGLGVICLILGIALLVGLLTSTESSRWPRGLGALAPLALFGVWLIVGGRRFEIDADAQTVKAWRAWPLPPATYELGAFYAVIVAPAFAQPVPEEMPLHLVGLIGADQLRLEVIRARPRDQARAAAAQLATTAKLPLIDESQTAAAQPPASVAGHTVRGRP